MTAKGIKAQLLIVNYRESGDGNGCLQARVHCGLWDCGVADMANLAMLFVGRVLVPMPRRLDGKGAHGENQEDC